MKVRLLYRGRDFDQKAPLPWNERTLAADLELRPLLDGMAEGDPVVLAVARTAILTGLGNDIETIRYRQGILGDCLENADLVREMYALAAEATESEAGAGRSSLSRNPDWVLRWASATIGAYLDRLEQLRRLAESRRQSFASEGLGRLAAMLSTELSGEYCAEVRRRLRQLRFRDGLLLGAALGKGNKGSDYRLLQPPSAVGEAWLERVPWLARLIERLSGRAPDPYAFTLDPQDETGVKALASLRNQALAPVAGALGEAVDHMRSFLAALRTELAFYVGCVNLHRRLRDTGTPTCVPVPAPPDEHRLAFEDLCEPALALTLGRRVVGNDAQADDKALVLVTGANQGGKSTFLRSVGLAQLMMQSGMLVAAKAFSSSLVDGLATHFRREEAAGTESGKLDDELARMSEIVDHVTPRMMILLNESFAATNELEGSEIARQIVTALMRRRVRTICVTHFYQLARSFIGGAGDEVLFLRAERREDGTRSFRMAEAAPLRTSFGEDLYGEIFPEEDRALDASTLASRTPRAGE
jgi:hypothetical protein